MQAASVGTASGRIRFRALISPRQPIPAMEPNGPPDGVERMEKGVVARSSEWDDVDPDKSLGWLVP